MNNLFYPTFVVTLSFTTFLFCSLSRGAILNSNDFSIKLNLNTSLEVAWSLWTNADKLENWLTAKAHVEQKVNGAYELFWDPSHPYENSTIGCHITSLIPNKLLAFEWKGPVPFADLMNSSTPPPTSVEINFEYVDPSKSVIHLRHTGWGGSPRWQEARVWQLRAWNEAFKNLKRYYGD